MLSHSWGNRNVFVTQVTPPWAFDGTPFLTDEQTRAKSDLRLRGHDDQGLRPSRDESLSHQVSQPDQAC